MGGLAWVFACGLRFHTKLSKYVVWPLALIAALLLDYAATVTLPTHLKTLCSLAVLGSLGFFDLSAIPAALCCCLFERSASLIRVPIDQVKSAVGSEEYATCNQGLKIGLEQVVKPVTA